MTEIKQKNGVGHIEPRVQISEIYDWLTLSEHYVCRECNAVSHQMYAGCTMEGIHHAKRCSHRFPKDDSPRDDRFDIIESGARRL